MFTRPRDLRDPVTIYLDGSEVTAERGEPLAAALLAADKTILARSPKLHRPRSPSCFRGGCDGCLARVDGVPNVMTCQKPAKGGERIESQNVLGSRKADLLRVTDWFFAKGIDHHHLMAGVPGLQDVMLTFARKVAGLGRMPTEVTPVRPAKRVNVDVAVVGGGVAGIAAASKLGSLGLQTLLVDDGLALGGALAGAPSLLRDLLVACPLAKVEVSSKSVAAGRYEDDLLVASGSGEAMIVKARATLFATGAHDGILVTAGNDLPGVISARALCRLLSLGLEPDGAVAIVGEGFWADELDRVLAALGKTPRVRVAADAIEHVKGTGGVKAIGVREGGKVKERPVVALGVDLPGAPAFELPEQAGARTRFDPKLGYVVVTDERGQAAEGVWAAGECTGKPFDPQVLRAEGERVAGAIAASLA